MLSSLSLVACTTNTTAVGTEPIAAQVAMAEQCQGAAVTRYGVTPDNVDTDPAVQTDGGFEIKGIAAGGAQGTRVFNCRFDSSGKFIGVMEGLSASPTPS